MKNWTLTICVAALSALLGLPHRLRASCGQAFCPIETSTLVERPLHDGQLYLNLVYEFIDQDQPFIGTRRVRVGQIRRDHDEQFTRNNTLKLSL
ncbi:MAG: hypothetical protein HYZ72_18655, partial [Deltaproteobacteria bacterium]|nr:hypothetical protein [Deltaproteobacteria bacterium]